MCKILAQINEIIISCLISGISTKTSSQKSPFDMNALGDALHGMATGGAMPKYSGFY